jgi:site-specific DNA-methyltransferase (adenine-specific)
MIKLLHGDCLELMKTIPDGSIDAIITDPPYGTTACKWDSVIPFEPMWEELKRIIKPNGAIVLFGSEPFSSALRMSNIKQYKYDWVWDKKQQGNHGLAKYQPLKIHENILIFIGKNYYPQMITGKIRKKGGYNVKNTIATGMKQINPKLSNQYYPKSILEFSNANKKGKVHPTQKPVELMEYLIKTYTNENEVVLDFTMGSGTTGVACKNLNRNFIGIELDETYFNIAKERIGD